ncbi:NUDIX hydrolase 6-like protein [Tanacetum coccineum]
MEEINNFQQEPDETLYQAWELFKELLMKYPQHFLTEMQETAADAKVAIQEIIEYSQKWHNGTSRIRSTETSDGLAVIQAQLNNLGREIKKVNEKVYAAQAKRHEENSNMIKEIRASTDAAIRNQGASITTLEIQIGQMSKVLQEIGFGSLPSSTEANPRDHVKSISTIVEADTNPIRRMGSSQYAVSRSQNRIIWTAILGSSYEASHIDNSIPRKEKDLGSFTLPCYINNVCFNNALADLGASVSVMPLSTYLNLGLGELAHTKLTVELADRTAKYPKGIAKNVLVGYGCIPTIPRLSEGESWDPIRYPVDIIHPEPVAAVAFPAAAIEELTALRFRADIAEAENASLRARIKTTEAIEKITRNRERQARVKIEQQLAAVQESQRQDREDFRKLKELVTSQFGRHS